MLDSLRTRLLLTFFLVVAVAVGTVAWLGKGGGELASAVDAALVVPSDDTGLVQAMHLALEHVVVELVEAELA